MTESIPSDFTVAQTVLSLQKLDHQSMAQFLHDDIGQNLVAIRSFVEAILEQDENALNNSGELIDLIKQATESAYCGTYNLMQELRSQDLASHDIATALEICFEESNLRQKNIESVLEVYLQPAGLELYTRAFILRSTRSFINICKRLDAGGQITASLTSPVPGSEHGVELDLVYTADLDSAETDFSDALEPIRNRVEAIGGKFHTRFGILEGLVLSLSFNSLLPFSDSMT
ncbi:MAG: hypothetical protein GY875_00400 [Gammaproteobacteria bacterium]|nr:hypothetical protein [Gammaproteobacteria bacterium]